VPSDRGAGAEARGDHIWLVPEPSSDPADPLIWSNWRKFGALWTISLYSFVANFTSASVAPALPFLVYAFDPPQSLPSLTHLIAVSPLRNSIQDTTNWRRSICLCLGHLTCGGCRCRRSLGEGLCYYWPRSCSPLRLCGVA
jgi:hypothetical protein